MLYLILSVFAVLGYWLLAIITLAIHEVGHAIVALSLHVPIRKAGLSWKAAYIVRDSGTPHQNILISIAGPLMNILIGLAFIHTNKYLEFFALMNFVLAGTNLLPITGSDGDRILNCLQTIKKEKQCLTHNSLIL